MQLVRIRFLFFLAFIACALIVGATAYLARVASVSPCPLCFMQRVIMLMCAATFLIASVHSPHKFGWRFYSSVVLFLAVAGAAIAARQVWLQATPPEDPVACAQTLRHLLDTQPFIKVVALILADLAGCSEITWTLFGISLPEWSLLAFTGICVFALYCLFVEFRGFGSMNLGHDD